MSDDQFAFFSEEYAQALQALKTIEDQASTLMVLGGSDELRTFIEQFLEMATRTKAMAEQANEAHFAEWFGELIEKAETLKDVVGSS